MGQRKLTPHYLDATSADEVAAHTDDYFRNTRRTVEKNEEVIATYAAFVRHPTLKATKFAEEWLKKVAKEQGFKIKIESKHKEGDEVGAGDALLYFTGPMSKLVELETQFLQKIGMVCVAAYNAKDLCLAAPKIPMLELGARHCPGPDMHEMMAYAAKVGTDAAKKKNPNVIGFTGTSTAAASFVFGQDEGVGTMPHAFVGYAKWLKKQRGIKENTLAYAARLYREANPHKKFIVLPDYDGQEITDAIAVCEAFPDEAANGELQFRLDTHGGRFLEGLDKQKSYEILEKYAPHVFKGKRTEEELNKYLLGEGVTAAAIFRFREALDEAGYPNVKIVGSSGFGVEKSKIMIEAKAPLDAIGTGSFYPDRFKSTYATADIICYGGDFDIKVGREHLIKERQKRFGKNQPNVN